MELSEILQENGCGKTFIEFALNFSHLYEGNVKDFISITEELLTTLEDEQKIPRNYFPICENLDSGAKETEFDYHGDNFESGGTKLY